MAGFLCPLYEPLWYDTITYRFCNARNVFWHFFFYSAWKTSFMDWQFSSRKTLKITRNSKDILLRILWNTSLSNLLKIALGIHNLCCCSRQRTRDTRFTYVQVTLHAAAKIAIFCVLWKIAILTIFRVSCDFSQFFLMVIIAEISKLAVFVGHPSTSFTTWI